MYGELFLVLQTQPEYIAKLTRLVSQKGIDGILACLSVRQSLFKPSTYMYMYMYVYVCTYMYRICTACKIYMQLNSSNELIRDTTDIPIN